MKNTSVTAHLQTLFGPQTDTEPIITELFQEPGYYELALARHSPARARRICLHCDCIEFEIRCYLLGWPTTLHAVFRQVRQFIRQEDHALPLTTACLQAVEKLLLAREYYELMPRFEQAYQRLQKQFGIPPLPSRHL